MTRWQRLGPAYAARSLLIALVVLVGACGPSEPASTPAPPRSCGELEGEVANLVVDLADHAAASPAGLPRDALQVDHPDDVDLWELATSLADGSPDLEARVETTADAVRDAGCPPGWAHDTIDEQVSSRVSAGAERLKGDDYDAEEHTRLNLMAILAANFAPPPETYDVPDGFPPEFPVHPEARLTTSEQRDDESVTATWAIENGSLSAIADFYQSGLQEIRFGGWSVGSSSGGSGEDGGHQSFEVDGYRFAGTVSIQADEDPGDVTVTATFEPTG